MSKKKKPLVADGKGLMSNEGKNKLSLIPPEWIFGLGVEPGPELLAMMEAKKRT